MINGSLTTTSYILFGFSSVESTKGRARGDLSGSASLMVHGDSLSGLTALEGNDCPLGDGNAMIFTGGAGREKDPPYI